MSKIAKAVQKMDWMKVPHIRNALTPATGTGKYHKKSAKTIRLCKRGCANRPFYQIVVMERRTNQFDPVIEQVGTYDPMPNKFDQIMVSLNYERISHWIGKGAHITRPASELLGIAGFLPIYPKTYMNAWRNRAKEEKLEEEKKKQEAEKEESA